MTSEEYLAKMARLKEVVEKRTKGGWAKAPEDPEFEHEANDHVRPRPRNA